ncbi:MAG: putative ABC transporter ATP-binding protein YbhF [bacterium ADurb.Bin243]|nr:MAG: putative ABC transporter ATP-binding protein YbhF [bacterium ADurb.Bin243]
MNNEIAVSVKDLYKKFGDFNAVDGITFDVKKGSIFGFLGPNGAGKSTTIKMLCGLLTPSAGSGRIGGLDIMKDSENIKKNIGYMSQKFSLYDDLSVMENIKFFGSLYGLSGEKLQERSEIALKLAGLEDKRDALTRILPGGIKQRLALGCAILHRPDFLFLDEPTSGVDPISRRNFWEVIHEFAAGGITVFVTTHYMEEAEYCDYLVLIYKGKVVISGTPGELKTGREDQNIYKVVSSSPAALYELLCEEKEFPEVNVFGESIHLVSALNKSESEAAVRKICEKNNILFHSLERTTPSLEDIFVLAIAEADRASAKKNGAYKI